MIGTSTQIVDLQRLAGHGPDAATVVKLMMACNDMTIANLSLADWKQEQPRQRRDLQTGARLYFVRTELAHLYEGLKVIPEIRGSTGLSRHLETCDRTTKESFADLETYAQGGARSAEFERLVGQIRNMLTFHYHSCSRPVERAIADRAARPEARFSTVTRGSSAHRWRFGVADDLVDSIVVRQVWRVPRAADTRAAVDEVAVQVHAISLRFLDFSGEFIWRYVAA